MRNIDCASLRCGSTRRNQPKNVGLEEGRRFKGLCAIDGANFGAPGALWEEEHEKT